MDLVILRGGAVTPRPEVTARDLVLWDNGGPGRVVAADAAGVVVNWNGHGQVRLAWEEPGLRKVDPDELRNLPMSEAEARGCVELIRRHLDAARGLLVDLWERDGWVALGYESWRQCVTAEFAHSTRHLYRELAAGLAEQALELVTGSIPESVLRPLTRLTPDEQRRVWARAQEVAGEGPVTAAIVQDVVAEYCPPEGEAPGLTKKPVLMGAGHSDEFQTPPEALPPLLSFLPRGLIVWECACGQGKLARALSELGYTVIQDARDFFQWSPPHFDVIVTNPPYTVKDEFLERAYSLKRPFAFLLPLTALEGKGRQALYREHGLQVVLFPYRVNFDTPSGKGSTSWFPTAWFTWGLNLPDSLTFWHPDEHEAGPPALPTQAELQDQGPGAGAGPGERVAWYAQGVRLVGLVVDNDGEGLDVAVEPDGRAVRVAAAEPTLRRVGA